jgi:ketosteroid isomerase-like protein
VPTWYQDYLSTWNTNDLEGVLGWFTEDCSYEDTTIKHQAHGAEGLRRFVQSSFENVPDATFDFVRGVDDGTTFAIEWIMQPMGVRGVSIGVLREGKIAENRDYWNGKTFDVPNT